MRRIFLKKVGRRGGAWLWGVTDHVGRGLTILAVLGLPAGLAVFSDLGAMWLAAALGALALVALFEGAYETWRADYSELVARQAYEGATDDFRHVCSQWVADVERLLDARGQTRPRIKGVAPHELEEQQRAIDSYDRETVATYFEKYRDKGVKLFDALVDLGHIVSDEREAIRSPDSIIQVREAASTIEFAASRIGSEGF